MIDKPSPTYVHLYYEHLNDWSKLKVPASYSQDIVNQTLYEYVVQVFSLAKHFRLLEGTLETLKQPLYYIVCIEYSHVIFNCIDMQRLHQH